MSLERRILVWMCVLVAVNQLGFGAMVPSLALYAQSFGVPASAIGMAVAMYGLARCLSALPADVFEAARVDRASAWQRFRHITLPLIRPAIVIVVIMRTMIALSAFAAIFAATGGGPGTATEILNLYAYRTSFSELNLGYGAALAIVLLAITLVVSFVMFRVRRAR